MPEDRPRRARSHHDHTRTPTRGVPLEVDPEVTPPPQMPPVPVRARTPTPDELRLELDALRAHQTVLTDAVERVWDARHMTKRMDAVELDLKSNTRSTIRMEAVLAELVVPQIKETMAKLDLCVHHMAAGGHVASSVTALGAKLDDLRTAIGVVTLEQATAAERFDAHDARDREIEKAVRSIDKRVDVLEQRNDVAAGKAAGKALVKKEKTSSPWSKLKKALVGAAVAGATAGLVKLATLFGG